MKGTTTKPELEAIKIITRLIPSLTYLELTALENAIQSRRYNMRKAESENFKSIEVIKSEEL